MVRFRVVAGGVALVAGLGYHTVGTSHLLGSPDPLMVEKTLLYLISAAGTLAYLEWQDRREGGPTTGREGEP